MLQTCFSSTSRSISELPSSRTMPKRRLTGTVEAPGFLIFASAPQTTVTSKSVAVNSSFSPSARKSTFERIGRVVRVLTTFCTDCSPLIICSLVMVRFMAWLICSFFNYEILSVLRGVNKANNPRCQCRDSDLRRNESLDCRRKRAKKLEKFKQHTFLDTHSQVIGQLF